jgi:hypothetical protein
LGRLDSCQLCSEARWAIGGMLSMMNCRVHLWDDPTWSSSNKLKAAFDLCFFFSGLANVVNEKSLKDDVDNET